MQVVQHPSFLNSLRHTYNLSFYPISKTVTDHVKSLLRPGPTVVLFSGGWQLDFDAMYLELNSFQNVNIPNIPKNTFFVNPANTTLIHKVLADVGAENALFLHSAMFCDYQPVGQLVEKMEQYLNCVPQVILTIPVIRTDFNRLKYSCEDVAQQYYAEYVEDSFIIKRNRQLSKQA